MNLNLLLAIPRRWIPDGLLILALSCTSQAIAEGTALNIPLEENLERSSSSQLDEKNDLTLRDVVHLMLQNNPELASFAKEVRVLEGVKIQAGKFRNPELAVESEDINANTRPNTRAAQFTTIRFSQLIELGGKRSARINAASIGQELADKNYESKRLELIARVANVFTKVLAGQEQLRLVKESMQLAQKVVNSATKRVEAGKAPPIEETKAKVAFSTIGIELEQTRRDLVAARKQLSLLWGNPSPQFRKVLGDLESRVVIPSFEVLEQRIHKNPMVLYSIKNVEQHEALLEIEKLRRIPDITIGAGVRRYTQADETTAIVNVSIPIPLFDLNQGNLQAAHQRVGKAIDEQSATDLQLRSKLTGAYESLLAAQNEIKVLHDEVLPGARSSFDIANKGYELGRFSFLEMLDAQRTLFQNQVLYIRALANYHRLINEIERLIASPIDGAANQLISIGSNKDHEE
ncbi:MAG: TolC family protein [Proteobacteria bacterium]|nr:TolC family protein [Pseudomonadota bacterium]